MFFSFLLRIHSCESGDGSTKKEEGKKRKGINGRYEERRHKASRREDERRQEMAWYVTMISCKTFFIMICYGLMSFSMLFLFV